jgi:hypothetical protein
MYTMMCNSSIDQQLLASCCGVLAAKTIWAALVVALWVECCAKRKI